MKRSIQPDTEIEAVLVEADRPLDNPELAGIRHCYAASRYEEFFGSENITIHYGGVQEYFSGI